MSLDLNDIRSGRKTSVKVEGEVDPFTFSNGDCHVIVDLSSAVDSIRQGTLSIPPTFHFACQLLPGFLSFAQTVLLLVLSTFVCVPPFEGIIRLVRRVRVRLGAWRGSTYNPVRLEQGSFAAKINATGGLECGIFYTGDWRSLRPP